MPSQVIEYKCMLMSPGDVAPERDSLTNLANNWNAQIGKGLGARIDMVRWESHAVPDMAQTAQETINSQLVHGCDFGIALFWSKLGTATEKHPSGSAEEIYELRQKGARVMVYFCNRDIPQDALRSDQFPRLMELKKEFSKQGLYAEFSDVPNLTQQVLLHITSVVTGLLEKDRNVPVAAPLTAETPDVRVVANPHFIKDFSPFSNGIQTVLGVEVQNHSPVTVYLSGITFEMKDHKVMTPLKDDVTGESIQRRELQPGQSFTLYVDPARFREHVDDFVCARATDAVGRIYRSDPELFPMAIKIALSQADK